MRFVSTVLCALAFAVPAEAADIENVTNLDIAISGSIRQHCALGSIPNMNFGDIERGGLTAQARVAFECNVPFTMTVTGANGALTHSTMPGGQGPYSGALPYSIGIEMPVRHPSTQMVSRTFESRDIRGGGTLSSNGGIATDGLNLSVSLGVPSRDAGLLAGDYRETIEITIAPS